MCSHECGGLASKSNRRDLDVVTVRLPVLQSVGLGAGALSRAIAPGQ